ncbi:MAG: DUF2723 domain-containing protein, partial [Candidatus Eisenbacteria bacterium]
KRDNREAAGRAEGAQREGNRKAAEKTARPPEDRHDGTLTYGRRLDFLVALIVTLVSGVIFVLAAGRGVPFWDCGEFTACAYILGIPHPPGAALFVMMGRVVSLIPFGDTAFVLNLFTSVSSAFAVGFCALALARIIRRIRGREERTVDAVVLYAGVVLGSLAMAFGSTYWYNAIEAEVYGLTLLLVALLVWLTLVWIERAKTPQGNRILVLQSFLLFLGATNHMQAFLPIIPIFMLLFLVDRERIKNPVFWAVFIILMSVVYSVDFFLWATPIACALCFLAAYLVARPDRKKTLGLGGFLLLAAMLGYSLYGYVPIRAAQKPAINENNPENWKNFKMFLERKQYSDKSMFELMFTRKGSWTNQFGDFHRIGFWYHLKGQWLPERLSLLTVFLSALTLLGLFAIWKRDRKLGLYFLSLLLLFTVAMTLYLNFSDGTKGVKLEVRDRDYFYTPGFVLISWLMGIGLSALLGILLARPFASRELRETIVLALAILSLAVPIGAVRANYFTHDRSRFWVAEDLAYNMLVDLGENGILFTGGDNDTFPLWYIQEVRGFRKDVRIVNLSLLNTPWYIKQLKHEEPKIKIKLSDDEIENLRGYYRPDGTIVTIKDVVMPIIIRDNIAERPIYYAITVTTSDQETVKDKLIQEGLVKKIDMGMDQESINVNTMEKNFGEGVYRFRGLDDPTVYKDHDTVRLLTNYNACLYNLAQLFQRAGDSENAEKYTDMIRSFPHENLAGHRMLALLAEGERDWETALTHIRKCSEFEPDDALSYVKEAEYLEALDRKEEAVDVIIRAYELLPDDRMVLGSLVRTLTGTSRENEMIRYMQDWVDRHPDDDRVRRALSAFHGGSGAAGTKP